MFTLSRVLHCYCTIPNDKSITNKRRKHLIKTQKILQNNLYDKIEFVKQLDTCNQINDNTTSECFQLWDEIEELSSTLSSIRSQIKTINTDTNYFYFHRNKVLFLHDDTDIEL